MTVSALFSAVILAFEALGVITLIVGFAIAFWLSARKLRRGESGSIAFQTLRVALGASILLGLEIFVAADIIRTIYMPTFKEAGILAIIVVIRTVLSISIQIEIDGVAPWRRALLTSGGQVLANEVARDAAAAKAGRSSEAGAEQAAPDDRG